MIGQKEAVIACIRAFGITLPAKVNLTVAQFEAAADSITKDICNGLVSYSKPLNGIEVRRYVRSMIKNHLNKAVELNGGTRKSSAGGAVFKITQKPLTGPPLDKSVLPKGLLQAYYEVTGESDGAQE